MFYLHRLIASIRRLPRTLRHVKQRIVRGFSDRELWNLDMTIAEFAYPRLVAFRDKGPAGYPISLTPKKWSMIVDQIVLAFEILLLDEAHYLDDEWAYNEEAALEAQENERYGLKLFGKYLVNLWD